jgi:tryptophan 2-monooxygenase
VTVVPSFRAGKANASFPSTSWPYIDTPGFSYDQWLSFLGSNPIGNVSGTPPNVAIIGGGISGTCAAYELTRAGCQVVLFEQKSNVGGRCASRSFPGGGPDIAEMGSMRFPVSEFILDHYLQSLGLVSGGLQALNGFPDPGDVPTYVSYGGTTWLWSDGNNPPPGGAFNTVWNGWGHFYSGGITQNGNVLYPAPAAMAQLLINPTTNGQAIQYWKNCIKRFGSMTFYGAMWELFSGQGVGENGTPYDIPGGQAWSLEDFDKFGALGVGSGGFGPLYPVGFIEIARLLINGLEHEQKFLPGGIRSVPEALSTAAQNWPSNPMQFMFNSTVNQITQVSGPPSMKFNLTGTFQGQPQTWGQYDRVIVATTTRSMELTTNVTDYQSALIDAEVAKGVMRTHVVSSNKVAIRIEKFWANNPNVARCVQTDTLAHQVYTLDYGATDGTAVAFISYVWDDDAVKQQSITGGASGSTVDVSVLYGALFDSLKALGGMVETWVPNLNLASGLPGDILMEEWQSDPCFGGAFKLSQPGQDPYVQKMFFDYQKASQTNDTGVYLAGDCLAWNSGWVEGGLQTALNAAAGVIVSLGGSLNPDANGNNPLKIDATTYTYI